MNCTHGLGVLCLTCRPRDLRCDRHGKAPWRGTVICAADAGGCGRVWKLLEPDAHVPPARCEKHCLCAMPLVGEHGTARAICGDCYAERKAQAS